MYKHFHIVSCISEIVHVGSLVHLAWKENENQEALRLKSEITVKEGTKMTLDIACPYDVYVPERYELKLEKYKSLQAFIEREMMPCIFEMVILGSRGTVHKSALKVMIDAEMPKTKAKVFAKRCSDSNIISPYQIWNVRCKLVKEH